MQLDLIDHLRCPEPHEESPLVAAIDRVTGRDVEEGSLGCPVCLTRYPIRGFVADFTRGARRPAPEPMRADEEAATRLAAMLDARVPGAWYILAGGWGSVAALLAAAFDAHCVLADPPVDVLPADGVSILRVGASVPLASAWARGAAIDAVASGAPLIDGVVRALVTRGRLVAPVAAPLPADVQPLVSDDTWRVAERLPIAAPPVSIRRAER